MLAFTIRCAKWLAPSVRSIVVEAPRVARRHKPGHFVILRVAKGGERIPLTVAEADPEAGTITLVVQMLGATTKVLCSIEAGESVLDVVGPLGRPTDISMFGHVVLVGGGVGTAVIHPQARALKQIGNKVSAVIGGRSRSYVILEEELRRACDAVYPCTDDGSYGYGGFVTGRLKQLIDNPAEPVNAVIAAGPVPMMKAVAEVTRPYGIHTIVSLNPIMVDGTGMCGGCRVTVDGRMRFACVDGPEFDAHKVDFQDLSMRLSTYQHQENQASARLEHVCNLSRMAEGMAT